MAKKLHPFSGQNERRYLLGVEVREADGKPVIHGYAARFEEWSEYFGYGSWKWREKIRYGAFTKTLEEYDQRALWNHNPDIVLGRRSAGTLKLSEDEQGLIAEITPPDTEAGRGYIESVRRRDVTGMSFMFRTIREEWDEEKQERTLLEVKLYEVSPTPFPAYPSTSAGVRALFPDLPADESVIRRQIEVLRACLPDSPNDESTPVEGRRSEEGAPSDPHPPEDRRVIPVSILSRKLQLQERGGLWI